MLKIIYKISIFRLCLLLLFTTLSAAAQSPTPAITRIPLVSNQPIERQIKAGEKHDYQINLTVGQFLRVEIVQPNIDIEVKFFNADGKETNAVNNFGAFASAYIFYEVETPGAYRLEISADRTTAPDGKYIVKSNIYDKLNDEMRARMAAEKLFIQIGELRDSGNKNSLLKANELSEQILADYRKLGDKYWEGITLNGIGRNYESLGDLPKALEYYNQALPIRRDANDRRGEAVTLRNIGAIYGNQENWGKAVEAYQQSIAIYKAIGHKNQEAAMTSLLAATYNSKNDTQTAIKLYLQAAEIYKSLNDADNQADQLDNIARIFADLKEFPKAIEFFDQALALWKSTENNDIHRAFGGLGNAYKYIDRKKSLANYEQAIKFSRAAGDKKSESEYSFYAGELSFFLSRPQDAFNYYNQVIELSRTLGRKSVVGLTLYKLGDIFISLNEKEKAIEKYNQSLTVYREINNKNGEANLLRVMGLVYLNENKDKGISYLNQAIKVYQANENKSGEARVLINLGEIQKTSGEWEKAILNFKAAEKLYESAKDLNGQLASADAIGTFYNDVGEPRLALENYQRALNFAKTLKDTTYEGTALRYIAAVYGTLGEPHKELEYLLASLPITKAGVYRGEEHTTLQGIGGTYFYLGEREKALDYYKQALALSRTETMKDDPFFEARSLRSIGVFYYHIGDYQKAKENFEQSATLFRKDLDQSGEASVLMWLGSVFKESGDPQKSIEYLNQSLAFKFKSPLFVNEPEILLRLGNAYLKQNNLDKASDYFSQSLALVKADAVPYDEGWALGGLSDVYEKRGEYAKAIQNTTEALLIYRARKSPISEANALSVLMNLWKKSGQRRTAILYGKQAVNVYQYLRENIKGIEPALQKTYLKEIEETYKTLADLLIGEGRFAEAQNVLALLKEEEYFAYVKRDASEIKNLQSRTDLTDDERKVLERYNLFADRVTQIGADFQKLDDKKRKLSDGALLPLDEQKHYDELAAQLADANRTFKLFLEKELTTEFAKTEKKQQIKDDRTLINKLRGWGEGTVLLTTIAGDERYRVILTTPKVQVDGKYEIPIAELNKKIFAFRAALQNPKVDPRPLGKELYDILIKPIEKDLEQANAKTLVWSLDGTLRYIPLAALSPDGKTYLVEKYQTAIITSTARQDLLAEAKPEWRTLGVGVSNAEIVADPTAPEKKISFAALPGVKSELSAIVRDEQLKERQGITAGRKFIDADFNVKNFSDSLTRETEDGERKYTVVHVASHFYLGDNTSNSFLLLGGGKTLTLEEISNSPEITFEKVELVTLSACNTAFGKDPTGKEVDSLATFIISRGAKAVMATLWAVADDSTQLMMSEFYRIRQENPKLTKVEAMRFAQLAMIEGKLRSSAESKTRSDFAGATNEKTTSSPFVHDEKKPFAHPYYWSPFVLIGNWR